MTGVGLGGAGLHRFEAFFEFEDGAFEEVVGERGGGDGESKGEGDAEFPVLGKVSHARPTIGSIKHQPKKNDVKEVETVGDFAQVDEWPWDCDLDVKDGEEDEEGAKEDEEVGNDERQGLGCSEGLEGKQPAGFEPESKTSYGDCSSLQKRQNDCSAMEPQGQEASGGEELELDEAVDPNDAAGGTVESQAKKDDISERDGDDADGNDTAATTKTNDGWYSEVKLLLDGKAPEGADWAEPTMVKDVEIADKEGKGQHCASGDGRAPVVVVTEGVAAEEDQEIERPDAQNTTDGKGTQVDLSGGFFFAQEDGDDEVGAEHEKHAHTESAGFADGLEPASA